jgi:hypothetical protein
VIDVIGISIPVTARWMRAALDIRNDHQHWVERRDLAERLLALANVVKGAGELEAEENHSAEVSAHAVPDDKGT